MMRPEEEKESKKKKALQLLVRGGQKAASGALPGLCLIHSLQDPLGNTSTYSLSLLFLNCI